MPDKSRFTVQKSKLEKVAEATKAQVAGFIMPSNKEQMEKYFGEKGIAAEAAASLGLVFKGDSDGTSIAKTIDGSFLE